MGRFLVKQDNGRFAIVPTAKGVIYHDLDRDGVIEVLKEEGIDGAEWFDRCLAAPDRILAAEAGLIAVGEAVRHIEDLSGTPFSKEMLVRFSRKEGEEFADAWARIFKPDCDGNAKRCNGMKHAIDSTAGLNHGVGVMSFEYDGVGLLSSLSEYSKPPVITHRVCVVGRKRAKTVMRFCPFCGTDFGPRR